MNISAGTLQNPYNFIYPQNGNPAISINPSTNPSNVPDSLSGVKKADENDPKVRMEKRLGMIECKTCKTRKYQDQSDDPGVSFKAGGHISPESSAAVVMSHEQEHVGRESSKASREGRKVVAQNVRLETSVCPECGRVYVSGGETTTVTKADDSKKDYFMDKASKFMAGFFGRSVDVRV